MAWAALPGAPFGLIGPAIHIASSLPIITSGSIDATNEAAIFIGHAVTSDGASHTIDTTGSSSLGWRAGAVTFANGGTTVVVGLAAVDTAAGPPGRAANATNVITFDVAASFTGGGGGITSNAWHTSAPTTGTKTIANGDLIAFAVQMTARGGADSVQVSYQSNDLAIHRPLVTLYTGGSYAASAGLPNALITFSDGATGWFHASDVASLFTGRVWNSGSATKEYGQLYKLPFPIKVYGFYGNADIDGDCDFILYSDPLGTPVAEKTVSFDANTRTATTGRRFFVEFDAPYFVDAYENIGAVFKPGATNVTAYYKTLASATHRVVDPWGTSGYGISRASGAFADANSSLDHYYIGLIVGAFQHHARPQSLIGF